MSVLIANRVVGPGNAPFIIAEMSGNHNQSLDKALEIVESAAKCGAHAIKLQTYTADTITLDANREEFTIKDSKNLWSGESLHSLYSKAYTPWEWHRTIFDHAKKLNLICFSSPFDESAVDFLESIDTPAYKIASFENNHLPLIFKAASTGKPLIISTGMASLAEIENAVSTARGAGCHEIILLKCTSTYPADPSNTNLLTLPHLQQSFQCEVGLSDHTMGIGVPLAAISLGASVIEKHFTLDRSEGGVDSAFSLEPSELQALVSESERAWKALGSISYGPTDAEISSVQFRRSIYVSRDIDQGEEFTSHNLRIIRPGLGAPPSFIKYLLGKKAPRSFKSGNPLKLDDLLD